MLDRAKFVRLDKAIMFAQNAHKDQFRKVGNIPYIWHPLEVANIAMTITTDEDVIIAALLHDTVEDTPVTIEEIEENFGPRVRSFVASETENKHEERPPEDTWIDRKIESLTDLKYAPLEGKIVWLSDKVSNMRSFHNMYMKEGLAMWNHFHMNNPSIQKWYYQRIIAQIGELSNTAAYHELVWRVSEIFNGVEDFTYES